jgi:hypothetical protein
MCSCTGRSKRTERRRDGQLKLNSQPRGAGCVFLGYDLATVGPSYAAHLDADTTTLLNVGPRLRVTTHQSVRASEFGPR